MAETRDELAARMFPRQWAAVANVVGGNSGRKRHNLRRQAESELKLRELRTAGASCATCSSLGRAPSTSGVKGPICLAESDFHGYATTALGNLCTQWSSSTLTAKGE